MSPSPSYTIEVKNHSDHSQDYFLFSAPDSVSGDTSNDIWSNSMKTLKTPKDGVATFEISRTYYAICGTFDTDPQHGGKISVYKTQPVKVGTDGGEGKGSGSNGSTVKFSVVPGDDGACDISAAVTPGDGKVGSFVVDTGSDFTVEDANKYNYFIGIASSRDGNKFTIENTFTPHPNSRYYLAPTNIFYIASGYTQETSLIKFTTISKRVAIDFSARSTDTVAVTQKGDGTFLVG